MKTTSISSVLARLRAPAVCTLAASATLPAAFAQDIPPGPQLLAPIVVQGQPAAQSAPSARAAREAIQRTPGGVALVADTTWRDTQAATVKDVLGYTPGVFAQPKWGEDTRLSIRGSGLSRYYHLRGIGIFQDGVPLTNADGSGDLQSVDPTAYRYTEVYKGGNALRYGAAMLGGAINFVTPTGRDADRFQGRLDLGSFGWRRLQGSAGVANEAMDAFVTGSAQHQDGFRDHSEGESQRVSANLGLRLSDHAETRFYLSGVHIRQEIPGSVTREQALAAPRRAAAANLASDWQRNIDGGRLSNRTVIEAGTARYEFGGWYSQTHLDHPIYQYLDNRYDDYGAYARVVETAALAGHANRFTLGLTWSAGTVDARNFQNVKAQRGVLLSRTRDESNNTTLYAENAFDIVPGVSLIAGMQFLHAERERRDRYNGGAPTIRSGERGYDFLNPKLGVLWQVDPHWQVFGNVSRSAEPPSFGDMNFSTANDLARLKPQRATTFEVGTRGQRGSARWDVAVYRAQVRNELQCTSSPFNICDRTSNLDRTVHQGLEAGLDWTFLRGVFLHGDASDTLALNAAYTFSDFRFDGDRLWGDNPLPGVPRHYLRAEVLYRHPSGFYAGPNVEWVPHAYYVDNANSVATAGYALVGLRMGWDKGRYAFFVEGRNLAGKRYIASASITDRAGPASALFEPGSGRSIYAGVRVRY